jgi:hypothetical protein
VKTFGTTVLSCFALLGGAPLSVAEEAADVHPYLTDSFILDVGGYFPDRTVKISAGIGGGDFELSDDVEVRDSDETFSLDFGWRFDENWKLAAQYFSSGGTQTAVLEEDLEFNDFVFEAGSKIEGGSAFSMVRLFFARKYKTSENQEFGFGLGVHWLEISAFVQGELRVSDMENLFHRESVSVAAPLPNIGIWYTHSFAENWALKARYDYFSANIDPYDGTLENISVGLNYRVFKNAGLGLSYNLFALDAGIDDSHWQGRANVKYRGVFASLSFYW